MAEVDSSSTRTNAGARGSGASNGGASASSAANGGSGDTKTGSASSARSAERSSGASNGSSDRASTQFTRATDALGDIAYAVRQTTQQLRDRNHDTIASYVEQGAQQLEQLAQRLNDRDVAQLLRDARRLAHRQPALFVGSAFVIGLFGARFLKSSPSDESRTDEFRPDPTYGGYGDPGTGFTGTASRDEDAYASSSRRQGSAPTPGVPSPLDEPGRL